MVSNKIIKTPTANRNETYCPGVPITFLIILPAIQFMVLARRLFHKFRASIDDSGVVANVFKVHVILTLSVVGQLSKIHTLINSYNIKYL